MKMMESRSFEVLDSHKRMLDRQAVREENAAKERELSLARLQRRKREGLDERIERASLKLRGANVPQTISLIESMSTRERDVYLLAEELGQNRVTVLRQFPSPRKTVRVAVMGDESSQPEAEASAEAQPEGESPDESPEPEAATVEQAEE